MLNSLASLLCPRRYPRRVVGVKSCNNRDGDDGQPIEQVSNFEDEPSPYCKSNLKGLQDPSSPIGKLVDRQEVRAS